MTNMHVKRWKEHRHEIGYGHLYQGRFKSFPVETEGYFYQVVRDVERNALREFGAQAEDRLVEPAVYMEREDPVLPILSGWPLPRPVKTARVPGVHRVYNMTVAGEHVFHVTFLGCFRTRASCAANGQ